MAYGAFVQSIGVDSGTGTEASLAFQSDLASTNTIIVAVRFNGTAGVVTCTDSRGHTFTLIRQQNGTVPVYWWFVGSVTAGADVVTITTTNSVTMNWVIAEFEGASVFSGVENGGVGSGTALTSGSFTTTHAVALVVGVGVCDGQRGFTAGALFTEREEIEQRLSFESRVASSAGSIAATFTLSSSDTWTCVGAAFYSAADVSGVLYMVSIGGIITSSSGVLRRVDKVVLGVITPQSVVVKKVNKSISGEAGVGGLLASSYRQYAIVLGSMLGIGATLTTTVPGIGIIGGLMSLVRRRRR
jgi:hypothetical protein